MDFVEVCGHQEHVMYRVIKSDPSATLPSCVIAVTSSDQPPKVWDIESISFHYTLISCHVSGAKFQLQGRIALTHPPLQSPSLPLQPPYVPRSQKLSVRLLVRLSMLVAQAQLTRHRLPRNHLHARHRCLSQVWSCTAVAINSARPSLLAIFRGR